MKNQRINKADVVLVFQDLEVVKPITCQIESLAISFQAIALNDLCINKILSVQPKIILFSTLNLITSVEFYIEFLERSKNDMPEHHSILLTNNKESRRAFTACENGLFDNYVVINPLNEPNRLSLILLQALKLISEHSGDGIAKLLAEGNESLATCIDKGATLRESLQKNIEQCQSVMVNESRAVISNAEQRNETASNIETAIRTLSEQVNSEFSELIRQLQHVKKLNEQAMVQVDNTCDKNQKKLKSHACSQLSNSIEELEKTVSVTAKLTPYKLLIADNSPLFSNAMIDIFEENKCEVMAVNSGKEAIEKHALFKPDIMLLDYSFTDLNGIEVIKRIRETGSTTPVIVLSNSKNKSIIKKWIPFGIAAYIAKPSTQKTILNTVFHELINPTKILPQGKNYNLIKWLPEYSVDNELLDSQHKELFSLVNEYLRNDDSFDALLNTFNRLFSCIRTHFKEEEKILVDNGYPYAEEHIQKHKKYTEKLTMLRNKLTPENIDIQERIGIYLYEWLANHILKSDMHFKRYFAQQKISI
mgnify:CR=1 FL=1